MSIASSAIDRAELAAFLEEVLSSHVDQESWLRIMVNHYHDGEMEWARRECVRLVAVAANGDRSKLSEEDLGHLRALAAALRRP